MIFERAVIVGVGLMGGSLGLALKAHSLARAMTIGIVMGFTGVGSVMSLGPIFASTSLNAGSTGFGILVTSVGAGMGIGMASLGQVAKFFDREKLFPVSMLAASMATSTVDRSIGSAMCTVPEKAVNRPSTRDSPRCRAVARTMECAGSIVQMPGSGSAACRRLASTTTPRSWVPAGLSVAVRATGSTPAAARMTVTRPPFPLTAT